MTTTTVQAEQPTSTFIPIALIGLLFFIFGFVTWLNGALMPFLQVICDLNEFQALFTTFAFYIAYTVMAFPSSMVLEKTGYRNGMAIGLGIMAGGALLFIPAAQSATFELFLVALFVLGTGLTLLQTASNPYIVFLGPKESAAVRISIMGTLNKGAGVIAPIVFTALILGDLAETSQTTLMALSPEETQALSNRLIMPYLYMAAILVSLIGLIRFSPLPAISPEGEDDASNPADKAGGHALSTSNSWFNRLIFLRGR